MAAYRIPSDVIVEILVLLPVKSILRFKSVCKDWYTLINSSLFIQLRHNKSLLFNFPHNFTLFYTNDYSLCVVDDTCRPSKPITADWPKDILRRREYLRIVGSCNGLVCLCVTTRATSRISCFLICNPSTHSFTFKPNLPFSEWNRLDIIRDLSCGFGYDGEHDDYKIVVTRKVWKESVRDVYIYSCKADSWKCATHTPAEGSSGSDVKLYGSVVFANNMLHYIVSYLNFREITKPNYRIARLDLSSETWRGDLSFPAAVVKLWTRVEFGVLNKCLYLRLDERYASHEIWIMKGYNNRDEDLWIKTYNIPAKFHDYTLVAPSKDDGPPRLLFEHKYIKKGADQLLWYDPYAETTEGFELEKSSTDTSLNLCIASLVRIPGSSINF